ncbi:MAG: hypothetical protein H8E15_13490 [Planctomycetes bacterium]|nr:hypothetical protein [Planctomycetota bacterium]
MLRLSLIPLIIVALAVWGFSAPSAAKYAPEVAAGLRNIALASALKHTDPALALLENAIQASDIAENTQSSEQAEIARLQTKTSIAAIADLPNAADLPWRDWFQAEKGVHPDVAYQLFRVGSQLNDTQALEWAKELDLRTTPADLRLEAHKVLWQQDPRLAVQRGHRLVREAPRGTEFLHARYVSEVIGPLSNPLCEQVLLNVAHRDGLESQARTLAIQAVVDRKAYHLAADMAALYHASTGDLLVRKRGLKAAVTLDVEIGKQALMGDIPNKDVHPGLYSLVRELRQELNLPPID